MALLLGVDTGGTYTDAVLIRDESDVIASAKALTTRDDLAVGVAGAVQSVLDTAQVDPAQIAMAALSTTLATNALVEGQGGRVALVYIGFTEADLDRHGLREALNGDPALILTGGHSHSGGEAAPLDLAALRSFVAQHAPAVSGWAVAARFATRNPAHELAVAQEIRDATGAPVTCSHHLSSRLNGPKRAVTAVLNARLIGMIHGLIGRAQDSLADLGVKAPMMVVRGDGALMSSEQAQARPIETILSGPAASIVGATWLTGARDALVSDIGGTTTDVALLQDGRPVIDPLGAQVGGFRTMVEAVAMRTTGLGGDSRVTLRSDGLAGGITLGPRRVVPVSLIAMRAPKVVHDALDGALRSAAAGELAGQFVLAVPDQDTSGLSPRELGLLARIGNEVQPLSSVLRMRVDHGALSRLVARGLVQVSAVTPSDAAHVMGSLATWDAEAARKAVTLLARRRTGAGEALASDAGEMARMIIDQVTEQTVSALLETVIEEETPPFGQPSDELAHHPLLRRGLAGHRGLLSLDAALNVDVVGLGASAPTYYPAVGQRLRCRMVLPSHADVANAIGAVVGRVTVRKSGTVTSPSEGLFRAHLDRGSADFNMAEAALAALERHLVDTATGEARAAGAADVETRVSRDIRTTRAEAREIFVEGNLTVEVSGRPRFASED